MLFIIEISLISLRFIKGLENFYDDSIDVQHQLQILSAFQIHAEYSFISTAY